jgi:hypothetical protein
MSGYYRRDGTPITQDEWLRGFGDDETKRVAADDIGDVTVSTVWLGLDHSFGDGPPLIFETMVFGGDYDEWCERYATEAAAVTGHARIVAALRNGVPLEDLP